MHSLPPTTTSSSMPSRRSAGAGAKNRPQPANSSSAIFEAVYKRLELPVDRITPTYAPQHLVNTLAGGTEVELFDQGLTGSAGVLTVLRAMQKTPGLHSLALPQNGFTGEVLMGVLAGIVWIRKEGVAFADKMERLHLAGNKLEDDDLEMTCEVYVACIPAPPFVAHRVPHSLLTSEHNPPTLTHLYLNDNLVKLSPSTASILGSTLSSPTSTLKCLSLTSNPLQTPGLLSLLSHLSLPPLSPLRELHISTAHLTPDCVEPLAQWLEDAQKGGTRLQSLAINGNRIGIAGVRRLARTVIEGKCTGLLQLETWGNEFGPDDSGVDTNEMMDALDGLAPADEATKGRWKEADKELRKKEMGEGAVSNEEWNDMLLKAQKRNTVALNETRRAALLLLGKARVLFGGNAKQGGVDVEGIRRGVEGMNRPTFTAIPAAIPSYHHDLFNSPSPSSTPTTPFPFLRLPIELRIKILHSMVFHHASTVYHLYPSLSTGLVPPPPSTSLLVSPLTESQFLALLFHASSRNNLTKSIEMARAPKQACSWANEEGPEAEWMLRQTGCDRFQRSGVLART